MSFISLKEGIQVGIWVGAGVKTGSGYEMHTLKKHKKCIWRSTIEAFQQYEWIFGIYSAACLWMPGDASSTPACEEAVPLVLAPNA